MVSMYINWHLSIYISETNFDTEVTTNSMQDSSTNDLTEKYLEITDLETTTNQNLDTSSINIDASTFTIEIESKITVEDVTDEYPAVINQGHLFSIIRNGEKVYRYLGGFNVLHF